VATAPVLIRPFDDADAPDVISLVETALGEFGFAPDIAGVRRDVVSDAYSGSNAGLWVAEIDGALAGTVGVRPKGDRTCELKRLYVRGALRGHGLGRALYLHAEAFARSAGYERIWLESSRRFTAARRLYEANGFVLLEELHNDWEDNLYEKRLG
jgi:ribosomal protein S18 acetylase RimI-like enzyme